MPKLKTSVASCRGLIRNPRFVGAKGWLKPGRLLAPAPADLSAILGLCAVIMAWLCAPAAAQDALIVKPSAYDVAETIDRLQAGATQRGLTIFARIDHAKGARDAGLEMADSQVLIFGNPQAGTPLMQADPKLALDLPLRVAAWQEEGRVWIGYWSPEVLATRYGLEGNSEMLAAMSGMINALTDEAAR
jgi:uncharacterized protein (DUF302 family)